jgi:hypothetical protein
VYKEAYLHVVYHVLDPRDWVKNNTQDTDPLVFREKPGRKQVTRRSGVSVNFGDIYMIFSRYVRFPKYFTLIYWDFQQSPLLLVFNVVVQENVIFCIFSFRDRTDITGPQLFPTSVFEEIQEYEQRRWSWRFLG